ncbi:large conductance mechanosensitive channel protein MscL [Nocardia arthritidis]|uniref:Large-conductance mechanosensitive channel n=1 Tax=Nocardia arthritidis TaxID=228602 RepID=A0A6G9YRH9_9NOCA|nr:large conductance mechanosensitive channel protein MscL [Nocardia arthritidis]QIS15822.1 large conductance mechanosensitive channel protein MscL [Nocardia arthritidis]
MLKGFKDFLFRGNVVDLAVAVVIGTAFVAIVTAFTNGIINPILAVFGGTDSLGLGFRLVADKPATFVQVGPIITALINFVIIAAVLYFVLVAPAMHVRNRFGSKEDAALTDSEVLIQIRDLLAEGPDSAGGRHES